MKGYIAMNEKELEFWKPVLIKCKGKEGYCVMLCEKKMKEKEIMKRARKRFREEYPGEDMANMIVNLHPLSDA